MECADSSSRGESTTVNDIACRRRVWTLKEEYILIQALEIIIQQGWKCENGFRSGYLKQAEKEMRKLMSNCDLGAEPHICSRIHKWKKDHGTLYIMVNSSGFSWDWEKSQIIVEDDKVWAEYIKVDPNAKPMRHKTYPLYGKWCEIFGTERARGEQAEDCNIATDRPIPDQVNETVRPSTPNAQADDQESPNTRSDVCSPSSKGKRNKRKYVDIIGEQMVNLMDKFCDTTAQRLGEISQNFGYENKMSQKRATVIEELGKLDCLNPGQRIAVAKMLANNNNDLELFFSASHEDRSRMVCMMLAGEI